MKSKEGRTGARLTKDHLESVFIATGTKVPATCMDELLPLEQEHAHWDPVGLSFESELMWNAEKQAWGWFHRQAAPQSKSVSKLHAHCCIVLNRPSQARSRCQRVSLYISTMQREEGGCPGLF